jgi:hypothetical protein
VPGRLAKIKGPPGAFSTGKDAVCPETCHECQFLARLRAAGTRESLQLFYVYLTYDIAKRADPQAPENSSANATTQ